MYQDYQSPDDQGSPVQDQLKKKIAPAPGSSPPVHDWGPNNIPGVIPTFPTEPTTPTPPPAAPFNYEAARDSLGSYGAPSEENARRWAADHGIAYSGGDVINLPNGGGMIDIMEAFKSGNPTRWTWTPAGGNGPAQPGGGGYDSPAPAPVQNSASLPPALTPAPDSFQSKIRELLLAQLQGLSKPVSADDPTISSEMGVQSRLIDRAREQRRAAAAERAAQQGLLQGGASSGAFDAEVASGFEDAGEQKSAVLSNLMSRELQARRGQLAQLLSLATQSGDAESARALQLQIAQMDNELRRYGIQEQGRQFYSGLGEQSRQFNDQFGRQLGRDAEDDFRYRFDTGFGGL